MTAEHVLLGRRATRCVPRRSSPSCELPCVPCRTCPAQDLLSLITSMEALAA
eukprot:CAMPEP_0119408872 /NCGR_PEP_ID=MMETSP1335-20130426/2298_1 /TAXON_ID=259385 /ORGANISM="Chrysoculter rhomboideus, Strain RCC1486" /LENGTH=51 /DNA_ID=CAMNT_0007433163 /DNA_START=164 /DNA_END=315 /DNA_ORIENTATION=+